MGWTQFRWGGFDPTAIFPPQECLINYLEGMPLPAAIFRPNGLISLCQTMSPFCHPHNSLTSTGVFFWSLSFWFNQELGWRERLKNLHLKKGSSKKHRGQSQQFPTHHRQLHSCLLSFHPSGNYPECSCSNLPAYSNNCHLDSVISSIKSNSEIVRVPSGTTWSVLYSVL